MKRAIVFGFVIFFTSSLFAQQTLFLNDQQAEFKQAKEYYQKEYYSLAYPLFKELQAKITVADRSSNALNTQDIRYYTLVCALKQNESAAVEPARDFIELEINTARVEMMNFHLAEYYFRQKN